MFRLFQQSSSRILIRGEWPLVTNSGCKVIVKFLITIPKACFSDIILIFGLRCLLVLRVIVHLLSWFVVLQLTLVCACLPTYRVQITHWSRAGEWSEAIEQYSHTNPPCHASVASSTRALAGTLVQTLHTGVCTKWPVSPNRFHKTFDPRCVGELDRWEGSQKHNSYLI